MTEANLTVQEYQELAAKTAVYKRPEYPFLAISEEVGELNAIVAKAARKGRGIHDLTQDERDRLFGECGDVLWQLSAICTEVGFDLGYIAAGNIIKLTNRASAGTLDALGRRADEEG